jgi:hypothetical protein
MRFGDLRRLVGVGAVLLIGLAVVGGRSDSKSAPEIWKAHFGDYWVRVLMEHRKIGVGDAEAWWGARRFAREPQLVVSRIEMGRKQDRVYVPVSAWSGIADVGWVGLGYRKGGCVLMLKGGDAASSYTATLQIEGRQVTERVVRSSSFPDEAYEHTKYGYIPDDGR